jgi:transposase
MYIEVVKNRNSPPCILLRESHRVDGKIQKRTLCNLTHLPPHCIDGLRHLLKGGTLEPGQDGFEILRTLPHGHVAAVLGILRQTGLLKLISSKKHRSLPFVQAMIAMRVLYPASKLATARGLTEQTLNSSMAECLQMNKVDEDDLYEAMDWLLTRQDAVEKGLAKKHLANGCLVLYDVSSSYFEGRACPLARFGHSRDEQPGKMQVVYGLLCNAEGCPVAVEVFEGNTADPKTLSSQIHKCRDKFGMDRVVLVGDRGMLTEARIREDLRTEEGVDWITALRAPAIRKLVTKEAIQLSLFDKQDLVALRDPEFPGERLVACLNPLLAEERARHREDLLQATERALDRVVAATTRARRPLRGKEKIALRVGRVIGRHKMGKHFHLTLKDDEFRYERNQAKIQEEKNLDGIYVIRTSVPASELSTEKTVAAYKNLSKVERAFRCLKTVDLKVRPINHYKADRVRAHIFLCMLAYYVEWHMRQRLAPLLFDDEQPEEGQARRLSPVAPAQRSKSAMDKAKTKANAQGDPVHNFRSLLEDLGTIAINRISPKVGVAFNKITIPTSLQAKALQLLGASLTCTQY